MATVAAFVVLVLASSATYLLNDIVDRGRDAAHPVKRLRPIAADRPSVPAAGSASAVLAALSLGGALLIGPIGLAIIVALYLTANVLYTLRLKHEALNDVVLIACGFLLRAISGGIATSTPASAWFLVTATSGALFIAAGKRASELAYIEVDGEITRPILSGSSPGYLRFVWTLSATLATTATAIWGLEVAVTSSRPGITQASVGPLSLAILRYDWWIDRGEAEAPEGVLRRDPSLVVFGVARGVPAARQHRCARMRRATQLLSGWGRTAPTLATIVRPADAAGGHRFVAGTLPGRAFAFRGLGRSYGDAAQSAGGTVVVTERMSALLEFDRDSGVVRAEAGLSLDALLRAVVLSGWFIHGSRMVTLGGAVAADVHGKNHHRDGSFGAHVIGLRLATPDGFLHELAPGDALFDATIGGMGLTGLILDVSLKLIAVSSALVAVRASRAPDLSALLATLEEQDAQHQYSVAWIDCLSSGSSLGRGVVTSGDHGAADRGPSEARTEPLRFAPTTRLQVPSSIQPGLLNRVVVRVFNESWYRHAPSEPTETIEHATKLFHPLDGMSDWNHRYGPRGFVQYQYVVRFGEEDIISRTLREVSSAGLASLLAVLKRFGTEGSGLFSFPMHGWTLALDFPASSQLRGLLSRLDELVLASGGRLYLAKDARMPRALLEAVYPRLEAFRKLRRTLDLTGRIATDMSRRLNL